MSFLSSQAQQSQDDYNGDIKLDPSIKLTQPASSISWAAAINIPTFAATFWDKTIRIFQVSTQTPAGVYQKVMTQLNTVPLCCTWNPDNTCLYVGCMDGTIKVVDVNTMNVQEYGKHNAAVANLHYMYAQNVLISNAYENNINFWQGGPNPIFTVDVLNKVFVTDFQNGVLAGGTANEKIFMIDMNTVQSGTKTILDSVDLGKFSQIESIALDWKAQTIGIATVDGRANISGLTRINNQFKLNPIITFKANKQEQAGSVILYPVNSVGFNPNHQNWFFTAGSDGVLSFWDYKARNKIKSFNYAFNPICCSAVSPNGWMIAYCHGNDWHIGQEGNGKWVPRIGVHMISDSETKYVGAVKK